MLPPLLSGFPRGRGSPPSLWDHPKIGGYALQHMPQVPLPQNPPQAPNVGEELSHSLIARDVVPAQLAWGAKGISFPILGSLLVLGSSYCQVLGFKLLFKRF